MGVTVGFRNPDRRFALRWAWASLIANATLVLTGGLVRLTGSGLGCPTWPKCTDDSFVPHRALGINGVIEFGNRMLTYVLVAVAIATFLAVWRWAGADRSMRRLVILMGLGIPFQGVIGGITVLTDLNPWIVSLHLLLSMALVAASVLLVIRVRGGGGEPLDAVQVWLVRTTYVVLWVVIYIGTIVTGSGPHAGDAEAPRNGLDPAALSQLHADVVFLLIGLTVGCWVALRSSAPLAARAALIVLVIELAQGLIGFVQYATDLPIALVAAHLVGAAILIAAGTHLLLVASPRAAAKTDQLDGSTDLEGSR
ncbi:MAG: COX15/CtaA family protein [Actinomycetota bacterium]|nr:COX15/CtaA family protein [Actinomycetota bacterium]